MTELASYSSGTVSVAAGGTTVTGVGAIWSGVNARPGDVLQIGNYQTIITDVVDTDELDIPPWGGGAQTAVAYKIWQVSPQRFAGAQAMADVSVLVAALNTSGFFVFVDIDATEPDPSLGDDGQWAFQPTTRAYWLKTGGVWVPDAGPGAGDMLSTNNLSDVASAESSRKNLGIPVVLQGYLSGLTLSTAGSSSTFAVAAGVAVDSSNTDFMQLAASISKTTAAWAVGTGNGALDTGTIANSTWYHVYEIKRPDTGVVDVLLSTSASAPTMPAGYTLKRRIGSMKTNGSGQWIKFSQFGDEFLWDAPVFGDVNLGSYTNNTPIALTVPPGVRVFVKFAGVTSSATVNNEVAFASPDTTLTSADSGGSIQGAGASAYQSFGLLRVRTDTSRQIQARSSNALTYMRLTTFGWEDLRGKV